MIASRWIGVHTMASGSKLAVGAAIGGNFLVAIAKLVAWLMTGSAAMLSEALHSIADTMNQVLLMIGITRGEREATAGFPFGFGAERAVWSLTSGVGIFFLGCGVTVYHGIQSLLHPHELESINVALFVLLFSFIIEGLVLILAIRTLRKQAGDRPFFAFLVHEADPTSMAVVLEDSVACFGVILAATGIWLSHVTGNTAWDAAASILIGFLLGGIAIWLVARSRHLLIGPAIPADKRERIRTIIAASPVVEKIVNLRTRTMDSETYRVAADIEFAGEVLAEQHEPLLRESYPKINNYQDFHDFAINYADVIVEALGDEIDAIEDSIRKECPKARYLDIEIE